MCLNTQFCWFTQQSFSHSYFCKVSVPCWSLWGLTGDESFSKLLMLLKHISMPRHHTHCFVFSPRCVCYVLLSPINFEMPALVLTILCDWLIVDGTACSTHLCMHINASLLQSFTVCLKYSLQTKPSMLLRNIPLMSNDSKLYHLTVTAVLVEYSVLWTTENYLLRIYCKETLHTVKVSTSRNLWTWMKYTCRNNNSTFSTSQSE